MAATTLFSAPISPYKHTSSTQHLPSFASWQPTHPHPPPRSPLILLRASSSTPTVDKQEEDEANSSTTPTDQSQSTNSIPIGGCRACGKAEIERGCNGEGRIQGGIATVPGFGWWPIKAYRPCPGFVASGGRYRRQGQSMDEVAGFGSVPRKPATTTVTDGGEAQSSEKKEGPRKFKR